MVVDALIVPCDTNLADHLTPFGCIGGWDFVFREDGFKGAFWDACTAVDTGIGVDIKPRVLFKRLATHNTFHRAYINTSRITQAQTCNDMGHDWFLLLDPVQADSLTERIISFIIRENCIPPSPLCQA
jgi:hypothetical protein